MLFSSSTSSLIWKEIWNAISTSEGSFPFLQLHFSFSKVVDLCVVFLLLDTDPADIQNIASLFSFIYSVENNELVPFHPSKGDYLLSYAVSIWIHRFKHIFCVSFNPLRLLSNCNSNCPFFFLQWELFYPMWILSLWQLFAILMWHSIPGSSCTGFSPTWNLSFLQEVLKLELEFQCHNLKQRCSLLMELIISSKTLQWIEQIKTVC